jgi:hypothetical protein
MSAHPDSKSVQCLHCGAKPGEPCKDFLGGITRRAHAKRVKLAMVAAANPPLREQAYTETTGEPEGTDHG